MDEKETLYVNQGLKQFLDSGVEKIKKIFLVLSLPLLMALLNCINTSKRYLGVGTIVGVSYALIAVFLLYTILTCKIVYCIVIDRKNKTLILQYYHRLSRRVVKVASKEFNAKIIKEETGLFNREVLTHLRLWMKNGNTFEINRTNSPKGIVELYTLYNSLRDFKKQCTMYNIRKFPLVKCNPVNTTH